MLLPFPPLGNSNMDNVMAHALGLGSASSKEPNAPRNLDAIDRMKELLASANSSLDHSISQLEDILNRAIGSSKPSASLSEAIIDRPALSKTIYELLNDLELRCKYLSNEVGRVREQLP